MTDALVDSVSEYLNNVEISPGSSDNEGTESRNRQQRQQKDRAPITALTLPEPLKPNESNDIHKKTELERDSMTAANAINSAVKLNHKLSTGIIYRDYISDSSDLNSDTSSAEDLQHQRQQFRQSTGDLTIISKAVSVDTHNSSDVSSSVVPAQRNPVSDLLRSPSSSTESDDEEVAMTEYYSTENIPSKLEMIDTSLANSIHRHQNKVVLTTDNEPPSPPPGSSLKKILVHYDHKIIPDVQKNKVMLQENIPSLQPNIKGSRFITMEEELEENDSLYMSSTTYHEEAEEGMQLPNNKSTLDLSLPAAEAISPKKSEIRSLEQRRSIKRLNAVKELMETEETYSRDLGILCTHFFAILKEASCLTEEESEILVRNAMDILVFQEKFTEALIEAHGDEEEEKNGIFYKGNLKNIALCFIEWGPKFEIYLDYCVRQDHAVSVYNELLQTNEEFSNLIERLHTFHRVSFGFSRLKFDDYLIIPFQRIFRYRLLLQSIIKATQKDSEEYDVLFKAQNTIHAIATHINNEKSKMEAKRKTALFLSRLDSDWCLPKRWFNTLGVCKMIGTLEVRGVDDSKSKRVGCALFNHYMIMAKAKKHKSYEPKHWFPLRKFEIDNLPNAEGSVTFSWLLRSEELTLELSAICEMEKQIWIGALSKAIQESKDLYSNSVNSNEYLLEQLFVSSFDQRNQQKANIENFAIEAESPVHFPIPSGSSSFSQSAIFNKPVRSNNRSSQPVFGTQEISVIDSVLSQTHFNSGPRSPGLRSQSSINDLRDFFSTNVTDKWSQRKYNQYHTRCKLVDTKFDDVCTTPILTARANSMNRNGSLQQKKTGNASNLQNTNSSAISLVNFGTSTADSTLVSPSNRSISPIDILTPLHSNASSRRASVNSKKNESMIFRLAQRNSSLNRSNSINSAAATKTATAGLFPSNSDQKAARPTKFFGRMVEKLGQIGTPARLRKNQMANAMPPLVSSLSSTLLSAPRTLCSNEEDQEIVASNSNVSINSKKKFFPQFLHARHNQKK